jgi:hypothetical protein
MKSIWALGLIVLALLAGCGGTTEGDAGSSTGNTGLQLTASGAGVFSVDCWQDSKVDATTGDVTLETFYTEMATVTFTISDYYGQYADQTQGVTFERYTMTFTSDVEGAPPLSSETIYNTISLPLAGNATVSSEVALEVFGLEKKTEFVAYYNASTPSEMPVSYTVTVTFYGKDWLTQTDITTQFRMNLEVGSFFNGWAST